MSRSRAIRRNQVDYLLVEYGRLIAGLAYIVANPRAEVPAGIPEYREIGAERLIPNLNNLRGKLSKVGLGTVTVKYYPSQYEQIENVLGITLDGNDPKVSWIRFVPIRKHSTNESENTTLNLLLRKGRRY